MTLNFWSSFYLLSAGIGAYVISSSLHSAGNQTQGFLHTRQALSSQFHIFAGTLKFSNLEVYVSICIFINFHVVLLYLPQVLYTWLQ